MIFLILSILLNAYLILSFKVVERYRIPVLQAIVFNYITCVFTGSLVNGSFPLNKAATEQNWFWWALLMGTMFISTLNLIGFTAQRVGVSVASVVTKLSLVIPFLFSLYLYNEPFTSLKIAGVAVALFAVVFISWPAQKTAHKTSSLPPVLQLGIPVILFVGTGLLDTLVKYVEYHFLGAGNSNAFLIASFATAAALGLVLLLALIIGGRQKFNAKAIPAGIIIGVPNYFSIWALVKALQQYTNSSSVIIPVNNMGIVLVSSVVAFLVFGERLSGINRLGILLSLAAIALIAFG